MGLNIAYICIVLSFISSSIRCDINIEGNFKECTIGSFNHQLLMDDQCNETQHDSLFQVKGIKGGRKHINETLDLSVRPFESEYTFSQKIQDVFKINKTDKIYSFFVLAKREFLLDEIGYECKVLRHDITFSKDILFNPYTESESNYERLTNNQCLAMIADKLCYGNKMECVSKNECKYKSAIEPNYPWWFGRNKKTYFDCEFRQRIVTAHANQSRVIEEALDPCPASNGFCILENTIVVWSTTKLNLCPYERMRVIEDGALVHPETSTFISESHGYLFQL